MGTVISCVRSMDMDASFKKFNLFICAVSGGDSRKGVFIMNNLFVLKGFLAKSFEVKVAQNGKSYATGALAVATGTVDANGKKVYNYLPIKSFNKTAELMGEHLQAGDYVEISGQLSMNSNYTDKNGIKQYGDMFCAVREFTRLSQREAKPVEVIEPEVVKSASTIL